MHNGMPFHLGVRGCQLKVVGGKIRRLLWWTLQPTLAINFKCSLSFRECIYSKTWPNSASYFFYWKRIHVLRSFFVFKTFCHISNDQEGKRVEEGDRKVMQSHFTHVQYQWKMATAYSQFCSHLFENITESPVCSVLVFLRVSVVLICNLWVEDVMATKNG